MEERPPTHNIAFLGIVVEVVGGRKECCNQEGRPRAVAAIRASMSCGGSSHGSGYQPEGLLDPHGEDGAGLSLLHSSRQLLGGGRQCWSCVLVSHCCYMAGGGPPRLPSSPPPPKGGQSQVRILHIRSNVRSNCLGNSWRIR